MSRTEQTIELQCEMVEALEEVFLDFDAVFKDDMQGSLTLLNYAIKTLLDRSNPLLTSEVVASSLSSWMSYARQLSDADFEVVATVAYTSEEDSQLNHELLFMDTEDLEPN